MKVRALEQNDEVAPLRRRSGGAITPAISWLLYADNRVVPLRRRFGGAFTPTAKWCHNAEDSQAAEPELARCGFHFLLEARHERRELVDVCRYLLGLGVLRLVAGDEDGYISYAGDALYDIQRRAMARLLAVTRGPSTWPVDGAPPAGTARLQALVEEFVADSDEGRRTAMRHQLARRLLDDPVIYLNELTPSLQAYFQSQRGPLAARLCEASGLQAEQRAEGVALIDEDGSLSDVAMADTGTAAHVTLLVADFLVARAGNPLARDVTLADVIDFVRSLIPLYGRYWSQAARELGAEAGLATEAIKRLEKLRLARNDEGVIHVLPALARYAAGEPSLPERAAQIEVAHAR